jgi:hypothetical protein
VNETSLLSPYALPASRCWHFATHGQSIETGIVKLADSSIDIETARAAEAQTSLPPARLRPDKRWEPTKILDCHMGS